MKRLLIMMMALSIILLPASRVLADDNEVVNDTTEEVITEATAEVTQLPPIEDTFVKEVTDENDAWMLPNDTEAGTWYYSRVYEKWTFIEKEVSEVEDTTAVVVEDVKEVEEVKEAEEVEAPVPAEIDIEKLAEALATANASMQANCEHKWMYNEITGIYMCTLCGAVSTTAPGSEVEEVDTMTFFGRLFDYAKNNASNILGIISTILLIGYYVGIKCKALPLVAEMRTNIKASQKDSYETVESQNKVVGAVNDMIDVSNATVNRLSKMEADYSELAEQNKAITVLCLSIFEAYNLAQTNNKNLPQGVKDVLNSKYAQALNILGTNDGVAKVINAATNITDVVSSMATASVEASEVKEESPVVTEV